MLGANGEFPSMTAVRGTLGPPMHVKRHFSMTDILNLALPYFGLIFIGFTCGKA